MDITFGVIVMDGMPFIKYQLHLLYPIAHQIIICEGSVNLWDDMFGERRSTDGTVEFIMNFPDPDNKITLIQKDWKNKNHMTHEYSKVATGDVLWHVDVDEFFEPDAILSALSDFDNNDTNMLKFRHDVFFGDTSTIIEQKTRRRWEKYWCQPVRAYRRLDGFLIHHIPNYVYFHPKRNKIVRLPSKLSKLRMFHFSYSIKEHVEKKIAFYTARIPDSIKKNWYEDTFLRFRENRDKWIKEGFDICPLTPGRKGVRAQRLAKFDGEIPNALAPLVEEMNKLA